MYSNGKKIKDIAAQFNVSVYTVYYWVKSKDDLMKKKNDFEAPENQKQDNSKIKLKKYNLNIINKSYCNKDFSNII